MTSTGDQSSTLHSRTLLGVQEVIGRGLNYVNGVEKVIVSRSIQMIQPRIEQRIRLAPEEDLRAELKYLHDLLGTILMEPPVKRVSALPKASKKRVRQKSR